MSLPGSTELSTAHAKMKAHVEGAADGSITSKAKGLLVERLAELLQLAENEQELLLAYSERS